MNKQQLMAYIARKELLFRNNVANDFKTFACHIMPSIEITNFHEAYYEVLNLFAHKKIRKLIITVPPQHGKSLASSQLLPAYILGLNPDAKIAIACYAFSLATKFNKRIQRTIKDRQYARIFNNTKTKDCSKEPNTRHYMQTSEEFEIVGYSGGVRSVGREGGLTGNPVDIAIMDDLYKDAMEGNSPTIRDAVWEWYTSVVKTRLHNNSQELIVFTRWHEEDLIGKIEDKEKVITLKSFDEIDENFDGWYKLNFEAIKESEPTEIDPRPMGEPLWTDRHGLKLLNEKRALDTHGFECMYQGHPSSKEGYLYGDNFKTYSTLPQTIKKANYTDTADTGDDYLCSLCYEVGVDGLIYITDILYTQDSMEVTEGATASMMKRNATREAYIESNNGGRGFARNVQKLVPETHVEWFHQSGNKESRILTNSATVLKHIVFPEDWRLRWSEYYRHVTSFKRNFRANKHDDCTDTLTGIVEREVFNDNIAFEDLLSIERALNESIN